MNTPFKIVAILFVFLASSCGKYPEGPKLSLSTKQKRLVGEWKVQSVNGVDVEESVVFEFDSDGDHRVFDDGFYYVGFDNKTHSGTWDWEDKKANIFLDYDYIIADYEIQIKKLSKDEFWFDDINNELVKCTKQ
ncbi:MAG: hypothetical protein ACPGTP_07935 [Bacteroidia bacterium]